MRIHNYKMIAVLALVMVMVAGLAGCGGGSGSGGGSDGGSDSGGGSDGDSDSDGGDQMTIMPRPPSQDAPDLEIGLPTVSDANPETGANFTLSVIVSNQGSGLSPATTVRYKRSTDGTITTSDTEVETGPVGALSQSDTAAQSILLTAPSTPGTYYYGGCVDAVPRESDTTNNCSASVQVDVSEPQANRDGGNGTRAGATNLGDITENSSSIGENGRVYNIGGPGDRVDYFRFSLSEERRVQFVLRTVHSLETHTDLFLEDATGVVLRQETSTAVGPLSLSETLQAGTYYLRAEDDSGSLSIYIFTFVVSQ